MRTSIAYLIVAMLMASEVLAARPHEKSRPDKSIPTYVLNVHGASSVFDCSRWYKDVGEMWKYEWALLGGTAISVSNIYCHKCGTKSCFGTDGVIEAVDKSHMTAVDRFIRIYQGKIIMGNVISFHKAVGVLAQMRFTTSVLEEGGMQEIIVGENRGRAPKYFPNIGYYLEFERMVETVMGEGNPTNAAGFLARLEWPSAPLEGAINIREWMSKSNHVKVVLSACVPTETETASCPFSSTSGFSCEGPCIR